MKSVSVVLSPSTAPAFDAHVAADVAVASDDRVADARLTADAAVRPDDRAADHRVFLDLRLPADHRVRADPRARLRRASLVDEAGTFDRGAVLDLGVAAIHGARRGDVAKRLGRVPAVHDVAMHLRVLRRRADVDPVAVVDVGDERFAALDERREIAAFDRPGDVARNAVERVRLEHVDAGVDVVGRDLVGVRLLEKAADVAIRVGFDQAVGRRIVDRRQDDRRARLALAVQPDDAREIDLRQHVAVEHDDRFGQLVARVLDGARRAERRGLDDVADLDPELGAVAEDLLDAARLVVEAEDDFVDLRNLLQQIDLIVEKRPVEDRNDRLRRVDRERPEPRALAPGQKDRLHDNHRSYTHRADR